jgi:hypothetical protein
MDCKDSKARVFRRGVCLGVWPQTAASQKGAREIGSWNRTTLHRVKGHQCQQHASVCDERGCEDSGAGLTDSTGGCPPFWLTSAISNSRARGRSTSLQRNGKLGRPFSQPNPQQQAIPCVSTPICQQHSASTDTGDLPNGQGHHNALHQSSILIFCGFAPQSHSPSPALGDRTIEFLAKPRSACTCDLDTRRHLPSSSFLWPARGSGAPSCKLFPFQA